MRLQPPSQYNVYYNERVSSTLNENITTYPQSELPKQYHDSKLNMSDTVTPSSIAEIKNSLVSEAIVNKRTTPGNDTENLSNTAVSQTFESFENKPIEQSEVMTSSMVGYLITGVTFFFGFLIFALIRWCIKRRDGLRNAYRAYIETPNTPLIRNNSVVNNNEEPEINYDDDVLEEQEPSLLDLANHTSNRPSNNVTDIAEENVINSEPIHSKLLIKCTSACKHN